MWKARVKHARSMPGRQGLYSGDHDGHFVKHARPIWAVRVVWGRWESDNFKFTVDVKQCPSCCGGPRGWTATLNDRTVLTMPGLLGTVSGSYLLELEGWLASVNECFGQSIALGNYGDYSGGNLYALEIYLTRCRLLALISMTLVASRSPAYLVQTSEGKRIE
ncbi:hypothetical protein F5141DRAFT_767084 [Pisolithus sp. B1]|nr:hypothetical protein F5141DRAFT_767084 [Pisolithus sp. B1]